MTADVPERFVIPDEQTPRTYGILNIVFASMLLLCNLVMAGMALLAPTMKGLMEQGQGQLNLSVQTRHQERLDDLKRVVCLAKTPAEKAKAQTALTELEAEPKPPFNSMTIGMNASNDRRIIAFNVIDLSVGFFLNLAMLLAGVGLIRLKESGRKAAVVVAGIKLVKLVLFVIVSLSFIVPLEARLMEPDMAKVRAQFAGQPGAAPPMFMLSPQVMAAMMTSWVILFSVCASIYPILVLIKLRNDRVKAACRAEKPPGLEPFR